jgi:hypothetical protein
MERAMLIAFLDAPQRPLSGEQLLQATRVHEDVIARSIDVKVLRLRRKLESDPTAPNVIRTGRGGIAAVRSCFSGASASLPSLGSFSKSLSKVLADCAESRGGRIPSNRRAG